jgi:colicin import membrane protein
MGLYDDAVALSKQEQAVIQLVERVDQLVKKGEAIQVSDASTCLAAKEFKVECKSYEQAVNLYTDSNIQNAKERLAHLQTGKKQLLAPMQSILDTVESRRRRWEEEERRKAEAEARKLQEEMRKQAEQRSEEERRAREREVEKARKAGEIGKREAERLKKEAAVEAQAQAANVPKIEVKAAIPTLQGVASRRQWKFRIVAMNKIPLDFMIPDEQLIGRMVRDVKDKAQAEAACPGIEVWSE